MFASVQKGLFDPTQVIGNVDKTIIITTVSKQKHAVFFSQGNHIQLQQRPVGVGVAVLLLALLLQVALEGTDGFGVVALEAVDDVGDVVGPLGRVFAVHLAGGRRGRLLCSARGDGRFAMVGQKDFDGVVVVGGGVRRRDDPSQGRCFGRD